MSHVKFRFRYDDAGEGNQRDEVRDGHEGVDDIGEDPDGFEFEETAGRDEADEDDAVRQDDFDAAQIFGTAFAVIIPAEDGRERKENEGNHEEIAAERRESGGEGRIGECGAV